MVEDVYIHYPYEDARFRCEKATGKVFKRFYGHPEKEIGPDSASYRAAQSSGRLVSKEDYYDVVGITEPVLTVVLEAATSGPADAELPELEAELRRLTSTSRMPPSAVRRFFGSHGASSDLLPAIAAFRKPALRLRPGEDLPVSHLTKIALEMAMKPDSPAAQRRQEALDALLRPYEQEAFPPEDRDFYRRLALASFIREHAIDERLLRRPMGCAFLLGDVYIDFPFEDAKFRWEKATGKVYERPYGKPEREIETNSTLYHDAVSSGKLITREDYFHD